MNHSNKNDHDESKLTGTVDAKAMALINDSRIAGLSSFSKPRFSTEKELQLQAILDNAFVGIAITKNGLFELVGQFACNMFGYTENEMLGHSTNIIHISDGHYRDFAARVGAMFKERGHFNGEQMLRRKDGSEFWIHILAKGVIEGDPAGGTIWILEDVTKAKSEHDEIVWKATHDPLTKLPTRRLLGDMLECSIKSSAASKQHGALMFIDLDNFKPLNDLHGHEMGDVLLVEVAHRLKQSIRDIDVAARFGGDEFVVLFNDLGLDRADAIRKAKKLSEKIRKILAKAHIMKISSKRGNAPPIEHKCTATIGVAMFGGKKKKASSILTEADKAMYRAKRNGRNSVVFFDEMPALN